MDLNLSEEERMFVDSVSQFLAQRYSMTERQRVIEEHDGFSRSLWRAFAELGWMALPVAERHGGLEGGTAAVQMLLQRFGRALVLEPYPSSLLAVVKLLQSLHSRATDADMLNVVMDGSLVMALAHREPGQGLFDPAVRTVARRQGSGWRLSGQKRQVLAGAAAQRFLVTARLEGDGGAFVGTGCFIVPCEAHGVQIESYPLADERQAADLCLEDVELGAEGLLGGDTADAWPSIEAALDEAVAGTTAEAVGVLEVLVEATVEYCTTRKQFGRPLAGFQAIQHRIADMAVAREEARSALLATMLPVADASTHSLRVASARVKVGCSLRHIAREAVQLHGAMGVTEELSLGAYFKRAECFEHLLGSTAEHRRRYAVLARGLDLRESLLAG